MSGSLQLRVGDTRQLRPPAGVARWTSSAPAVVSTTDEDLISGKPGGLVVAIRTGHATVTAFGFDHTTKVLELVIEVQAGHEAAIRVAKNETAALPDVAGVTRWVVANPRVAEVAGTHIRGIAPGITAATGEGSTATCPIEVTGTLNVGVGQSVDLGAYVDAEVKSWRTSCPSDVKVDAQGRVTTGDRARTVEVSVELASGATFSMKLRISDAPAPASVSAASETAIGSPLALPQSNGVAPAAAPAGPGQQEMVESFLLTAEAHLATDDWVQAAAAIAAARVAAATDTALSQRVEQLHQRFRATALQKAGAVVVDAVGCIAAGDSDRARRRLETARLPREWQALGEGVRRLVTLTQRFAAELDDPSRISLELELETVWNEATRLGLVTVLPVLAGIGLGCGERIVSLVLDALCNPALPGLTAHIRQTLGTVLGEADTPGVAAVFVKLADGRTSPSAMSVLLAILPDLPLHQNGAFIVRFFRNAGATEQRHLVERLAAMHTNTPGALFELLAGVLNRMPPDPALAKAIQGHIKSDGGSNQDQLEIKAVSWATRGHRPAQLVLQRLYGYDANTFAR